ncbi:MAG: MarR family transcriptional regulator [Sphingomonadales bacterium]
MKKTADKKLMEAAGITTAQAAALAVIETHGRATQKQVAQALSLNESAMTATVSRLKKLELIERSRREIDGRMWHLELTKKGKAALQAVEIPFDDINITIDSLLGKDALEDVALALKLLSDEFK